jgi:DNA-binding transcriptional ArsR family regulator
VIDLPKWIDPKQDAVLTPKSLRGLVHPLRIRLLQLLQDDGPATATSLAERIEQSSGVASYHLRVLAEHGFIVEDTERGTGRDRWWRAVHRETSFTFRMPEDPGDADTVGDAEEYLRLLANEAHRRVIDFVNSLAAQREELPKMPWQMNVWPIRLTVDEARELAQNVHELVLRYRREPGDPDPRPDTMRAVFQFQVLPDDPGQPLP